MASTMGFIRACLFTAALPMAAGALAADTGITGSGDLEMRCTAIPTIELTPEAAREFNVAREAKRGLLTVTIFRNLGQGRTQSQPAQVFAGAINQNNLVSTIPLREVRKDNAVYYLGEFHVSPPDTLRFLVKANAAHGIPLKTEFSRAFGAP